MARARPPLKPSGWDGGTEQSAPNAPKDGVPLPSAQKSETARRTSWTARPTRMRTTTHATGRAERRHDRQPQRPEGRGTNSLPRAQRGARLSGRDAEIARPDAGGVWAQERRRAFRYAVPLPSAQKSETARRTSWTARPTRMRTTTHATGRAERRHDRQPQRPEGRGTNSLPRAQRGARLSGRDAEIARPDAGGVWAQERRRAFRYSSTQGGSLTAGAFF